MESYDLVIVGAGPAGLTSAIYAAREKLKTAIISKDIGGTANTILKLENWPGFSGTGEELMHKFYEQVKKYDVDFIDGEVKEIAKKDGQFFIKTEKDNFVCKSIILATGTKRKRLSIPGEKDVSYCATCDGFFFKNKFVGVIGGNDCAATSAIALSGIAKEVYVFYRKEQLRCEKVNLEILKKKKNVKIVYNAVPLKILGKEKVEGIEIEENGRKKDYALDGVFIEIGASPITEFAKKLNLKLDSENAIVVDEYMKTSAEGVFAAGDVTNLKVKQVLTSSAQGAIAGKSAGDWLKSK